MKLKLQPDAANLSDELSAKIIADLKSAQRNFESQRRGFLVIAKERDALKAENDKLKVELEWYKKRYPGKGLSA